MTTHSLTLSNFEGPLAFLLQLVRKSEIDIFDIPMSKVTEQYLSYLKENQEDVDAGGDFIHTASTLLWLKSRMLLPRAPQEIDFDEVDETSPFSILPQLMEYASIKESARKLGSYEEGALKHHFRAIPPLREVEDTSLGIERVAFDELAKLFAELMERANARPAIIKEEAWRVSDKIALFRAHLKQRSRFSFTSIFDLNPTKGEVVVTFLALLELMKIGEIRIYLQDGVFIEHGNGI